MTARSVEQLELQELNQHQNHDDRHAYWRGIYDKYDRNHDGTINICELRDVIQSREYENDIPDYIVKEIFKKADTNGDGELDFKEFLHMVNNPKNEYFFSHLKERYIQYVKILLPPKHHVTPTTTTAVDGAYEDEYSCCPPPVFLIIISLIEIILFMIDVGVDSSTTATGQIATSLLYDPHRRKEAWRYATYMFVHVGYFHLVINILVQVLLGTPLEMVHNGFRIALIYVAGVVAGSLGTSISDPTVKLAGASGGVYSLMTAHLATIILNWSEMSYPFIQLIIFVLLIGSDVGTAIYQRYVLDLDQKIGYAAHFFGALAGLLVGITVLRNIEVKRPERTLQLCAGVIFVLLMGTAIIWNGVYSNYFPVQYV